MKILIVEVNWIGDVLFSTPAIRALKEKFPNSSISVLALPLTLDVLKGNPYINEIIVNDEEGRHQGFSGKLKLIRELRNKKFDLAVLFHRSVTRAAITWLSGILRRVGYAKYRTGFFLTDPIPMLPRDSSHRVDYYLGIVKNLGCDIKNRFYELWVSPQDEAWVDNFLKDKGGEGSSDFMVCLNPGGNWAPKRWPKENFSCLADLLIKELGAKVIFTGSKGDLELVRSIKQDMKLMPIIASGETNLKQLACLFKRAKIVVSGDSGPLHIAAAMGANVLALFGPTSPQITAPLGKGKIAVIRRDSECPIPCYTADCADNTCMRNITPQEVLVAIRELLAGD